MNERYIRIRDYAELYDVDPRTVRKWGDAGIVEIVTVTLGTRTIVRVRNRPPRQMRVNTSQTRTT